MPNLTKGMRKIVFLSGEFPGYDENTMNMLSVTCAGAMETRESGTAIAFTHGNAPSI
jgi:hypothetical protein